MVGIEAVGMSSMAAACNELADMAIPPDGNENTGRLADATAAAAENRPFPSQGSALQRFGRLEGYLLSLRTATAPLRRRRCGHSGLGG
jgi:hypothetical protein